MPQSGYSVRPLSKTLQKLAHVEQEETEEHLDRNLENLREWFKKQSHLPQNVEDQFLLNYIRGSKYSLKHAKEKLDFYFSAKAALPEFFNDQDPLRKELQDVMCQGFTVVLPRHTPEGLSIGINRVAEKDPDRFPIVEALKVGLMRLQVLLQQDDSTVVNGLILVFDLEGFTLGHLSKFSLSLAKKFVLCLRKAFAMRVKSIHIINAPPITDRLINLIKPFTRKKVHDRIFVYGKDFSSLYKHVPQKILPKEYGGEEISMEELVVAERKTMNSYRNWLMDNESLKADESKRKGESKTYSDLFGMEGSFRQISVD